MARPTLKITKPVGPAAAPKALTSRAWRAQQGNKQHKAPSAAAATPGPSSRPRSRRYAGGGHAPPQAARGGRQACGVAFHASTARAPSSGIHGSRTGWLRDGKEAAIRRPCEAGRRGDRSARVREATATILVSEAGVADARVAADGGTGEPPPVTKIPTTRACRNG